MKHNNQAPSPPERLTANSEPREFLYGVHSIFATIQGEGIYAGMPAIFVRLAGCNLQCPACFGWRGNSRQPTLRLNHGGTIPLGEAKVGDEILTLDENGELVPTTITNLHQREVDVWLEVIIEDKKYSVTPEHPFFTNRGMIPASDLRVGDEILHTTSGAINSYKKKGVRNPMQNTEVSSRKALNTDYSVVALKVSAAIKRRKANGLSWGVAAHTDETKLKVSLANRGAGNGNYQADHPRRNYLSLQSEMKNRPADFACETLGCETPASKLEVHHLDGNRDNDAPENMAVNQRGLNFWTNGRSDGKTSVTASGVRNGLRVNSIKEIRHDAERASRWPSSPGPKPLPVFNITCEPHPTYLADNMWVHNCDTVYTSSQRMSIPTIIESIEALKSVAKLIVISGGEPFRQPIGALCYELIQKRWVVQIETNGSLFQPGPWPHVAIVCSPKTGKVNSKLQPFINAYKYVAAENDISDDDGLPTIALGHPAAPRLARPHADFKGPVYLQPLDEQDEVKNLRNLDAVVESCLKFGHILCIQIHKIVKVP